MALEHFVTVVEKSLNCVESYLNDGENNEPSDYYDILNYKLFKLSLDLKRFEEQGDELFVENKNYPKIKEKLLDRYDKVRNLGYAKLEKAKCITPKDFDRVLFTEDDENEDQDEEEEASEEFKAVLKQFMLAKIKGTIHEVQQYLKEERDIGFYNILKLKVTRFQEVPSLIKDLRNEQIYAEPLSDEARKQLWDLYVKVDKKVREVVRQGGLALPQRFRSVREVKRYAPY